MCMHSVRRGSDGNSWSCNRTYLKVFIGTFCLWTFFGVCGVLPDLDHFYPVLSRRTHFPLVVVSWCVFSVYLALVSGRVYFNRLRGLKE